MTRASTTSSSPSTKRPSTRGFVGAVAHERRIGAAPAEQIERVDDQGLARAGLAGDHGQARADRQQQVGDDPEVLDAQLDRASRSPIRKVELGFEDLVEVARPGSSRAAAARGAAATRHAVAGAELAELAAVEGEHHSAIVAHVEAELFAGRRARASDRTACAATPA